jgi:hypothetical protein
MVHSKEKVLKELISQSSAKDRYDYLLDTLGLAQINIFKVDLDEPEKTDDAVLENIARLANLSPEERRSEFINSLRRNYSNEKPKPINKEVSILQQEALMKMDNIEGNIVGEVSKTLKSNSDEIVSEDDKFVYKAIITQENEPNWERLEDSHFETLEDRLDREL